MLSRIPPSAARNVPSVRRSRKAPSRSTPPGSEESEGSVATADANVARRPELTTAGSNAAGNDEVERAASPSRARARRRRSGSLALPGGKSFLRQLSAWCSKWKPPAERLSHCCSSTGLVPSRSIGSSSVADKLRATRSTPPVVLASVGGGTDVSRWAYTCWRKMPSPSNNDRYGLRERISLLVPPASSQISRMLSSEKSYTRLVA